MPNTRTLSDQELVRMSHHWRRCALGGSTDALFEARRHEGELRRRFSDVDRIIWANTERRRTDDAALQSETTLAMEPERVIIATADTATKSGMALQDLLHNLRTILDMDIAFVAELVDGRKVYRHLDYSAGVKVKVEPGASVPLEITLCQRVVDGRAPQVMQDVRSDASLAELSAVKSMDIGAYISAPVVMRDGSVYGTLCCISHQARSALGTRQLDSLHHAAGIVAAELEKRRS